MVVLTCGVEPDDRVQRALVPVLVSRVRQPLLELCAELLSQRAAQGGPRAPQSAWHRDLRQRQRETVSRQGRDQENLIVALSLWLM